MAGTVTVRTTEYGGFGPARRPAMLGTGERLEMTARDADPAHAELRNEVVYRLTRRRPGDPRRVGRDDPDDRDRHRDDA